MLADDVDCHVVNLKRGLHGEYGLKINNIHGKVKVTGFVEGSPASKSDLKEGYEIVEINGEKVVDKKNILKLVQYTGSVALRVCRSGEYY